MEDLEDKIGVEQERKKLAEEKLQARNKLLVGIREGLDHLIHTLVCKRYFAFFLVPLKETFNFHERK